MGWMFTSVSGVFGGIGRCAGQQGVFKNHVMVQRHGTDEWEAHHLVSGDCSTLPLLILVLMLRKKPTGRKTHFSYEPGYPIENLHLLSVRTNISVFRISRPTRHRPDT